MQELVLDDRVMRFDGQVLEIFRDNGSTSHFHIRYIKEVKLSEGKKGATLLEVEYADAFRRGEVPPHMIEQARQFIAAVQAAMDAGRGG